LSPVNFGEQIFAILGCLLSICKSLEHFVLKRELLSCSGSFFVFRVLASFGNLAELTNFS